VYFTCTADTKCITRAEQNADVKDTSADNSSNASLSNIHTDEEKNGHKIVGYRAMEAHGIDETNTEMDTLTKDVLANLANHTVQNAAPNLQMRRLPDKANINLSEENPDVHEMKKTKVKDSVKPENGMQLNRSVRTESGVSCSLEMRKGDISDTSDDSSNDSLDLNKYINNSDVHRTKSQVAIFVFHSHGMCLSFNVIN